MAETRLPFVGGPYHGLLELVGDRDTLPNIVKLDTPTPDGQFGLSQVSWITYEYHNRCDGRTQCVECSECDGEHYEFDESWDKKNKEV